MTRRWWQETTIYHIYPRSFYDTTGDGIGDLPGIIEKLPYLRDLGVGAIWMGPVFSSPQVDNGYDVSDYRAIDPLFGTIADMDRLIARAEELGIRVLLDLVFNHSSDRHEWFVSSRSDRDGEYGDYYIWRDATADGGVPNNWRGFFGGSVWEWSPEREQYYLHLFAPEQPDLNWENPRVRADLLDVANFWIDRGVAGFRMDVINFISKAPWLPSLPSLPTDATGRPGSANGVYIDGPRLVEFLAEFRAGLRGGQDVLLVGETPGIDAERAAEYTDPETGPLDMVLLFDHLSLDHGPGGRWDPRPWSRENLRQLLSCDQAAQARSWPAIYLSNHDQPRIVSRYGNDREYRYESATALATVFYLQRGTPILYQGDEIAMRNYPITRVEEIVDIESRNAYRELVEQDGVKPQEALDRVRRIARDNGRTPMQWSATPGAGFIASGEGTVPWYPVNPDYREWNTEAQNAPGTVRWYIRRLLSLRRQTEALLAGDFEVLTAPEASPLVGFRRRGGGDSIVVLANLSDDSVSSSIDPGENAELLIGNLREPDSLSDPMLRPWECLVFRE